MEKPVPDTRGETSLALRREAHKSLGGRLPALLSLAIAFLGGALAGYGIRAFAVERGAAALPLRIARDPCPALPPLEMIDFGPPRVLLLGDTIRSRPHIDGILDPVASP
jgi:hypothetical protein